MLVSRSSECTTDAGPPHHNALWDLCFSASGLSLVGGCTGYLQVQPANAGELSTRAAHTQGGVGVGE